MIVEGSAGGPFVITGAGFGNGGGSVTFGGVTAYVAHWREDRIKGNLPQEVKPGEVVVTPNTPNEPNGVKVQKEHWPQPRTVPAALVGGAVEARLAAVEARLAVVEGKKTAVDQNAADKAAADKATADKAAADKAAADKAASDKAAADKAASDKAAADKAAADKAAADAAAKK